MHWHAYVCNYAFNLTYIGIVYIHRIRRIPEDLGRDIATVQALQMTHATFKHELKGLGNLVL